MVAAIARELQLRKNEPDNESIETIYFGGGTPSLLTNQEIQLLLDAVYDNYQVIQNPEITLEANPDDLLTNRIVELSKTPINRLSIGVQSFFEEDLKLMNRAHNSTEAIACLETAVKYFNNISVDLIYGTPGLTNEKWQQNIQIVLDLNIPHISSYALTVEPKTALYKMVQSGTVPAPKDTVAHEHFMILTDMLVKAGYVHYELSNFAKPCYLSKNNSAYWLGKKYIGAGPSAHSYNGVSRSWNIANNTLYIKTIREDKLPSETEILSITDRYNEYIMTGLRTIWGVSLTRIAEEFGGKYLEYLINQASRFITDGLLVVEDNILTTTAKGKFLADGLASDLFYVN